MVKDLTQPDVMAMFLSPDEAKQILGRALDRSRAESCVVSIEGGDCTNLRFARNSATTNGSHSTLSVTVESHFSGRSGSVTITSLEEDALTLAQARSEEIARLAPVNPEFMPPLGPQTYEAGAGYDAATAAVRAAPLAAAAGAVIGQAIGRNIDAAGYGAAGRGFNAMATSAGLFAYDRRTGAKFTVTARNKQGTWSGWAGSSETRFDRLDPARLAGCAIGKAAHPAAPFDLDPGKYTVILEPAAAAELVRWLLWMMDARSADEGRSFLSKKGGGIKLGERLFDERVTITSDPADAAAPDRVYGGEGLPRRRTVWVEGGAVKNLAYSRFWARKMGREPLPMPQSFVMAGGSTSVDDMIRETRRGILVTRAWYTNVVDPRTLLLTGLTRDGNFLIENGRIAGPARNLRFNESLVAMLGNIAAAGPSGRTYGGDIGHFAIAAPALLVKEFTFSSRSSGI